LLRDCKEHGFFRGRKCQYCEEEGVFLIGDRDLDIITRMMAGILRHFPGRFDLEMDNYGWVNLGDMVDGMKNKVRRMHWLTPHHIQGIVETDEKGRYQIKTGKIRATYAHTVDISIDLPTDDIPASLYYPCSDKELEGILAEGLKPTDRKKVHLSRTKIDANTAGIFRMDRPKILRIDAQRATDDGIIIYHAGKTVFITDGIPPEYISMADDE